MAEKAIEVTDLTIAYKDKPVLWDVDMEVPAGTLMAIVGPNGAGKTTLIKSILGLVKPAAGQVLVLGKTYAEQRHLVGYVPQRGSVDWDFPTSVLDVVMMGRYGALGWLKRPGGQERAAALEALEKVGIRHLADRQISQLSGGQQQRVGVARALAADPPVMLMDEPFGAIDPINRERLQNEFLRLQAELRKTVLFVTHDIDEAIKMGDRVAVLKQGGVLAQYATPAELLMAPADGFVEDFVGADRALKRLALMRVSDVDLWQAPLAFVGQSTAEIRSKLEGAEVPHALLVDSERRPLGWLSDRDLARDTVPAQPDSSSDPLLDRDDVLRDALSDLLQAEAQYAPVTDGAGRIAGVLSVEVVSDFLHSPEAAVEEAPAAERPLAE